MELGIWDKDLGIEDCKLGIGEYVVSGVYHFWEEVALRKIFCWGLGTVDRGTKNVFYPLTHNSLFYTPNLKHNLSSHAKHFS